MQESDFLKNHFFFYEDYQDLKDLFSFSVKNINIEISSFCNRSCNYCPVSLVDRRTRNIPMADDRFGKILRNLIEIEYSGRISLNLYNEPTADKDLLLQRISEIKHSVPMASIYFGTNGDYLNSDYMIQLAEAGVSELYVTLHPPKGELYKDEYVIWRFTEFAARLGKSIKIDLFRPGHTLQGRFSSNGIAVNIFSTNYNIFGTDRAGSVKGLIDVPFRRISPCNRPFNDFTISYDGTIFPCCQMFADDPDHKTNFSIGNLDDFSSIFHAYGGQRMAGWRRSLLTYGLKQNPCATCTEASTPEINQTDSEMRNRVQTKYIGEAEKKASTDEPNVASGTKILLRKFIKIIQVK